MLNILDLSLKDLILWMEQNRQSKFRAKQVFDWIYKKQKLDFSLMTNLPADTQQHLNEDFFIGVPKVLQEYKSNIDGTQKFLFQYQDGNIIEAVVMKYKHGNTICISTQIGCRMGCKFCASTIGGIIRNLSSGEMIGQVIKAEESINDRISNVVLMGSGEPLDNFDNVIKFINLINSEESLNIGQRHITLSTCGLVEKIIQLADLNLQITLAISLHATNDKMRKEIMPIANKYTLNELIEACKYYYNKTKRRITFEYALVKGINDKRESAEELCTILRKLPCHVNLIPVNEIEENNYVKSSINDINVFKNTLTSFGIETTIRREMGGDINAACGQLRRNYMESK